MKISHPGLPVIGVLAVAAVVSCATGAQVAEDEMPNERVCFNTSTVRSFDALSDEYVYVRGRRDEYFLITTRGWCPELRDAISMAFVDSTSRVCSGGFGKIVYRHGLSRGDVDSCRIDTIERVNSKEHAKHIVDARTGNKKNEGTWTELPANDDEDNPQ